MRVTRKTLQATNEQLRSQIAVHNHITRKGLNEMIRLTLERNAYLVEEMKKRDQEIARMKADFESAPAAV